jgi:hypothetical protein
VREDALKKLFREQRRHVFLPDLPRLPSWWPNRLTQWLWSSVELRRKVKESSAEEI